MGLRAGKPGGRMSGTARISQALQRFAGALKPLEQALASVGANDADRAALAHEVDKLKLEATSLVHNQREANRRIDAALAKIRQALGG